MKKWSCTLKGKDISNKVLYVIIASPGFFLLVNEYPLFAIVSNMVVLALGIFFYFYRGSVSREHYGTLGILLIIYAYFTLSYFISNQEASNFFSYQFLRYDGSFFFCYMLFFALAVPYFDYKRAADLYFKFIFFTFTSFVVIGIYALVTQKYLSLFKYQGSENYGSAFTAFNFAHNATGSVYAVVCVSLLAFFLYESRRKYKIFYFTLLIFCLIGVFLTKSRGSYVGCATGIVFILWFYFKSVKKFIISLISVVAVSLPIVFLTGAYKRIILIFDFKEANISWRFLLWERALYMFKQSPIFGIGFGRFNDISFPSSRLNDFSFQNLHVFTGYPKIVSFFMDSKFDFSNAHAHNSYLNYLAETGIVGLGLIIFFWILIFKKILNAHNKTQNEFSKKVFLSCMGSIVVLFALSLFENYFSATTVMMFISMVSSLSLGIYWQEKYKTV